MDREQNKEHDNDTIKVEVHYIAAKKPFKKDASPSETVGQLKTEALNEFQLVETSQKIYKLFFDKRELENMNETLGHLAEEKKHLKFDLEEFLVQGNS